MMIIPAVVIHLFVFFLLFFVVSMYRRSLWVGLQWFRCYAIKQRKHKNQRLQHDLSDRLGAGDGRNAISLHRQQTVIRNTGWGGFYIIILYGIPFLFCRVGLSCRSLWEGLRSGPVLRTALLTSFLIATSYGPQ